MKRGFLIFGILVAMLTACQDDSVAPGPNPSTPTASKSKAVKDALKVAETMQGLERLGFGSPSMFNRALGFQANGRSSAAGAAGRALTTAKMASDTTDTGGGDDGCDWTTCATEEFKDNGDGSYTWTIDYGEEGCEEHGYFMKGKMVETYREDGNTFSSEVVYTNFGDRNYTQNGTASFSGTWESTGNAEDSTDWDYKGSFSHKENLTISITEDDFNETFTVEAQGSESFDKNGFTNNEGFYKYTTSNGDFFNTTITTPLFYSYQCESDDPNTWVFVYVSGVESTTYKEGETTGEFTMDYGQGTCDNIVTITENGESYDVDLGKEWEDDWDDDGDDGTNG